MSDRKPISKKLRFEVFKRDKFQCQYCGKSAPDVVLQCDHISPVSKGGGNDILNLITSCRDCNQGKSDRLLDDDSVVMKQREMLAELEERRQQLQEMLAWREELKNLDNEVVDSIALHWAQSVAPFTLNENGRSSLVRYLAKFSFAEIIEAMDLAVGQYVRYDDDDKPTSESVEDAWHKIAGIIVNRRSGNTKRDLYYCRGILRNRLGYINERHVMSLLQGMQNSGVPAEHLKTICKEVRNWTEFREVAEEQIAFAAAERPEGEDE